MARIGPIRMTVSIVVIVRVLMAAALVGGVVAFYRSLRRRSDAMAAIVAVAILLRAAVGLAMFWISYLQLPVARSLQAGGGFWHIALDATGYYQMSAKAAAGAFWYPLDHSSPSAFYLDVLTAWMRMTGASPAAGMLLNLCLYVAIVALIARTCTLVNDWRQDLPVVVSVAAYSFSPVILLHSTQPLKDELSNVCIAAACGAMVMLKPIAWRELTWRDRAFVALGAVVLAAAILAMTGMRWYYGLMMWAALAAAVLIGIPGSTLSVVPRYVARATTVLLIAWLGFWGGSGPFYRIATANFARLRPESMASLPRDLLVYTQLSRVGFMMSGGASNVVVPVHHDAGVGFAYTQRLTAAEHASAAYQSTLKENGAAANPAPAPPPAAPPPQPAEMPASLPVPIDHAAAKEVLAEQDRALRAMPTTAKQQATAVGLGLSLIFVPTRIIHAVTGVTIPGGRGWLGLVDLDTLYLDATMLAVIGLLWTRRRMIADYRLLVTFAVALSCTTAVLLGYVVTNFGTLFRIRSLVAIPIWMLVLALQRKPDATVEEGTGRQSVLSPV